MAKRKRTLALDRSLELLRQLVSRMSLKTRLLRFRWILPGLYVTLVAVYLLALVGGAGHIPHGFDAVFYCIAWPCFLLDMILPKGTVRNPLLSLMICFLVGLTTYFIVGYLVDLALKKFRR